MMTSRTWFTAEKKAELWERWKNGQGVLAISRALERRNLTGIQRIVALHGGIATAPLLRAVAALSLEEREEISREASVQYSTGGVQVCQLINAQNSCSITSPAVASTGFDRHSPRNYAFGK
jgi:hypothetical protein